MKSSREITLTPEALLDEKFVSLCRSISAKRARTVINHILENGIITNEDLSEIYGYDHPPRAIRDVRENGIPLLTHMVVSEKSGRKIGAYTFGDPKNILRGRIGGRKAFSKTFKQKLIDKYGAYDAFTREQLDERYLQIDHRVPYEIAGESDDLDVVNYMLIDASSQRAKSWSCENCDNLKNDRDQKLCVTCFWAYPENYTHICLKEQRRLDVVWSGVEVVLFDKLSMYCQKKGVTIQDYIKSLLRK